MKTKTSIALLIVLLAASQGTFSQNSTNLLDENKLWSTVLFFWFPSGPHFTTYNQFEGDTLINDTLYKKVWEAKDPAATEWSLIGFMRNEENAYFLRNMWGEEGLVYNFDLQAGDPITVNNPLYNYPYTTEVIEVDSVLVEPLGEYRKRLKMAGNSDFYEYWIEGVGSNAGIVQSCCYISYLTGGGCYLLCEWENGQKIFDNEDFDYCYDSTVGIDEQPGQNDQISIRPMPLKHESIITISHDTGSHLCLHIYDLSGKPIFTKQVQQGEQVKITREQFNKGMYIVTLKSGNHPGRSAKLIVQ